jgi:hypothetical protein
MRLGTGALVLALALATGCATKTSTTQLWQAEYSAVPVRRVVVFGLGMAEAQRRSVEDHLAGALADHGVAATPSYQLFPGMVGREVVTSQGYDGAVVASVRATRDRPRYVPGYWISSGFGGGYYAGYGWGAGWSPGYVVTDELVDVETSLWDLRSDKDHLVWSALTETVNPKSGEDLEKSLTKEVLKKMTGAGVIPPKH